MVTKPEREKERRKPSYTLADCQTAIENDNYELGRKPWRDMVDLGVLYDFSLEDFKGFVATLTAKDFSKSIKKPDSEYWWDVYISNYCIQCKSEDERQQNRTIRIYFKFYICSEKLHVQVVSLHESS